MQFFDTGQFTAFFKGSTIWWGCIKWHNHLVYHELSNSVSHIVKNLILKFLPYLRALSFGKKTPFCFQYLERRFGFATRLACSLAFTFQMMLYTGIVLYAPALALEAVTGLSQRMSILIVGLCCLFYSTVGGIKAVIWTDVFQVGILNLFSVKNISHCCCSISGQWKLSVKKQCCLAEIPLLLH